MAEALPTADLGDPKPGDNHYHGTTNAAVNEHESRIDVLEGGGPFQPLDSDLTAIAALTTTTYGRGLLAAADAAGARTLTGAAADTAVVHLTGAETVAGVKTFSSTPVVPDGSFGVAKIAGTGTRSDTTFLRGDGTFATPAGGGVGGGVTVHNDLTGRSATEQHPTSAVTGLDAALAAKETPAAAQAKADAAQAFAIQRANHTGTQTLDTTSDSATRLAMTAAERTKLGGVAAGADATVEVRIFVESADMSGGTFIALGILAPNGAVSPVPREFIPVGAIAAVVSGPDVGLWTITASGPCTAGATLVPGTVLVSAGSGLVGVAAHNGTAATVFITVAASFDALAATTATANAAATSGSLATTDANVAATNIAVAATNDMALLAGRAEITAPPTRWLACGPNLSQNHWATPTVIATPTTEMKVRALARSRIGNDTGSYSDFQELYSEASDSAGVPGAGGTVDRFELALSHDSEGRSWLYWEHLEVGAAQETSWTDSAGPYYINGNGARVPVGRWIEVMVTVNFSTAVITYRIRTDFGWNHTEADGSTWRTTRTYDLGATTTMEASDNLEQWIGRGGGEFDVARVRRYDNGTLVMDMNASTAASGATTVTDSVMTSAPGVFAVWTRQGTQVATP